MPLPKTNKRTGSNDWSDELITDTKMNEIGDNIQYCADRVDSLGGVAMRSGQRTGLVLQASEELTIANISFGTALGAGNIQVVCTQQGGSTWVTMNVINITTTKFDCTIRNDTGSQVTANFAWIAIGPIP